MMAVHLIVVVLPTLGLLAPPFAHRVAVPAVAHRPRAFSLLQVESTEELLELWAEGQAIMKYTQLEALKAKQEAQRMERLGMQERDSARYSAMLKTVQQAEKEVELVLKHIERLETHVDLKFEEKSRGR